MAYVAELLTTQSQLQTIFEIAQYMAFCTFGLAILAVFFRSPTPPGSRGYAGWLDIRPFGRFRRAVGLSGSN